MAHLPAFVSRPMKSEKEVTLCKQTSFRAYDWLLFLFTIINLHEFVTILWPPFHFSKIGPRSNFWDGKCNTSHVWCLSTDDALHHALRNATGGVSAGLGWRVKYERLNVHSLHVAYCHCPLCFIKSRIRFYTGWSSPGWHKKASLWCVLICAE